MQPECAREASVLLFGLQFFEVAAVLFVSGFVQRAAVFLLRDGEVFAVLDAVVANRVVELLAGAARRGERQAREPTQAMRAI